MTLDTPLTVEGPTQPRAYRCSVLDVLDRARILEAWWAEPTSPGESGYGEGYRQGQLEAIRAIIRHIESAATGPEESPTCSLGVGLDASYRIHRSHHCDLVAGDES